MDTARVHALISVVTPTLRSSSPMRSVLSIAFLDASVGRRISRFGLSAAREVKHGLGD